MPRPPVDFLRKVRDLLQHLEEPPPEAAAPLTHYWRSVTDLWNLREYVERNLTQRRHAAKILAQHVHRLHGMILVNLIEAFERFLKETAAVCVDHLATYVLDDRFDKFSIHGSALAAHFGTDTLGKALCESAIWLDCDEINKRFRALLADPFEAGEFWLFPKASQPPPAERGRYEILSILWQVRHTIVHNVGVITQSDAIKLHLLVQEPVPSPKVLVPDRDDVFYVKRFLDETAKRANDRVGQRLAELLTTLGAANPTLVKPQQTADSLGKLFGIKLAVLGKVSTATAP
jgi:hypothetical protein